MDLRQLARTFIPRSLRNALRDPQKTLGWFTTQAVYRLGRASHCQIRPDWHIICHPSSRKAFSLYGQDPELIEEVDSFVKLCTPEMVLMDIGCHFGLFTLAALRFGGPRARAIAVDPSQEAIDTLKENLKLSEVETQAQIFHTAVGSKDGIMRMLSTGAAGVHYMVGIDAERSDAIEMKQMTIPTLVKASGCRPTHLKVDVEGYEFEVLTGGREYLMENQAILFLELHGDLIRARTRDPMEVFHVLTACGYTRYIHENQVITPEQAVTRPVIRLICTKK